jgi:hypothetical protein
MNISELLRELRSKKHIRSITLIGAEGGPYSCEVRLAPFESTGIIHDHDPEQAMRKSILRAMRHDGDL